MSGEVPVRGVHDNGVEPVSFCYRINSGLGPTVLDSGIPYVRKPRWLRVQELLGSKVYGFKQCRVHACKYSIRFISKLLPTLKP